MLPCRGDAPLPVLMEVEGEGVDEENDDGVGKEAEVAAAAAAVAEVVLKRRAVAEGGSMGTDDGEQEDRIHTN